MSQPSPGTGSATPSVLPADTQIRSLGSARTDSPLSSALDPARGVQFVEEHDRVLLYDTLETLPPANTPLAAIPSFELAGPRRKIFFDPAKTRAGIVTCGGICPGLNDVIRGVVLSLNLIYGVKHIYGFKNGFAGFIPRCGYDVLDLDPEMVSEIHERGGTILGSSRGNQDPVEIVDCLERMSINVLFIVGGDGTLRGGLAIIDEIDKRGLKISVIGIPKTIDNDILFVDQSFGFQTAYSAATAAIRAAHQEAKGAHNGVGLVKLMGRHSGFIACYASLAMSDANFVLIPEVPMVLHGENGFLKRLHERLIRRKHAVIVVAEGAGQDLLKGEDHTDASGNIRLHDIGPYLRDAICDFFRKLDFECSVKYIDPSYIIRSVPASPPDSVFCLRLAHAAVHAAMSGRTQLIVGIWHGRFVHIPMPLAIRGRQVVNTDGEVWQSVLESTGQPRQWS
ncbi:MAG TPA: ATP-dependent 6-phosphofructokinase [Phycisphaerae bacterium]|jgi:6-phosphofructokinase 1|nr:ATP-dependent 6-phosphofructokinase [Phycisphaerae bacterium]